MSGIAAVWRRAGEPVLEADLSGFAQALHCPGPGGRWQSGSAGLFASPRPGSAPTLDESQVWLASDGPVVIAADARLDNRADLLARLELTGRALTDEEIILAAYQAWGTDCPTRLLGDFAFVIWDGRRQQFFCARDPFGVRPLYYYAGPGLFACASTLPALLTLDEIPRRLNEDKVADFLLELFEDKARTFYQDIFRLPPAHWMVANPTGVTLARFWAPDPERELRLANPSDYAEAYRDLFVEAVRCRLRGNARVGSTLSGGLDSSAVACVAGRLLAPTGRPLDTFSAVFETVQESDERGYIQAVLAEGRYTPHFVAGDQVNPFSDMTGLMADEAEPYYSPQMFLNRALWASARASGVNILLEGLMGDNVVSHGFAWLTELGRTWRWGELYRQYRALAARHPDPQPAWQFMRRAIWQDGIKANLPAGLLGLYRRLRRRSPADYVAVPRFINPEFARRVSLEDRLRANQAAARSVRTARGQHALDLNYGLIPTAMEIYAVEADRFTIEPRFPFLDRRLAEFCLSLPREQLIGDGYTRWIARRALAGDLPEAIRTRAGKGDLSVNFMRGFQADMPVVQSLLDPSSNPAAAFVELPRLQAQTRRLLNGEANADQALTVFLTAALTAWLAGGGVSKSFIKGGINQTPISL